ncbi:alpha/beta hydrolase [uncultured Kordia sp.]|uniref:alpha/beta hydrolase n=1 Tax=uncultured Kordia sp. TaxID=507699 RepID=UPI002627A14C|nr:alpha/beta hydrolase [uncultured Kordia sp.]
MKQQHNIHIFGISGLGADKRIFDFLALNYDFTAIDWIDPIPKETIASYAQRLIDHYEIDKKPNSVILGVSFGGMIAAEMHELLETKKTFVISSAAKVQELPRIFSIAGKLKLIRLIPSFFLKPNIHLAAFLFGTKQKKLLKAIIKDTDTHFLRWGITAITTWKKGTSASDIITIHGTKDKVIPKKGEKTYVIENGGHFMIVDFADKISSILNEEIQ